MNSRMVDQLRALHEGVTPRQNGKLSPLELIWAKQVDPNFDVESVPVPLVRKLYADLFEFGPNKKKIDSFLTALRNSFFTCRKDNGGLVEGIIQWYSKGLEKLSAAKHDNYYGSVMTAIADMPLDKNLRDLTDFTKTHISHCYYNHMGVKRSEDLQDMVWTVLLIIALEGSFEKGGYPELERQSWMIGMPADLKFFVS